MAAINAANNSQQLMTVTAVISPGTQGGGCSLIPSNEITPPTLFWKELLLKLGHWLEGIF